MNFVGRSYEGMRGNITMNCGCANKGTSEGEQAGHQTVSKSQTHGGCCSLGTVDLLGVTSSNDQRNIIGP